MSVRGSVLLLTILGSVVTSVAPVSAQQPGRHVLRVIPPPKAAPLFPVQPFDAQSPQAVPAPVPTPLFADVAKTLPPDLKPRVVCGMTLLPAPQGVDPQIASDKREPEKPQDQATSYTIRPVQPSICWD